MVQSDDGPRTGWKAAQDAARCPAQGLTTTAEATLESSTSPCVLGL